MFIVTVLESLKDFLSSPAVIFFGAITVIEFVPIKVNPWKTILRWLSNVLVGEMRSDLNAFKRDFEQTKAQDKRWRILDFANSCRNGRLHSKDEWQHVISEISEYEDYTDKKHIVNGVIEEDAKYLRELYRDRNMKNDFL